MENKKQNTAKDKKDKITEKRLEKYFKITAKAIELAEKSANRTQFERERKDFLDMINRYFKDALYFKEKNDFVNAFAALNYAHGWLDAGARLGLFDVHNSELFTVD